ncbi:hypothetical protein [Winogradskyella sp. PG-2]|uniref:hypothetical protein n=1 Tax=Winogradskyella sp. PG-2 TaxID=754409 RepID=UPI0004587C77|nr:hypothetical protein [Winogradskyella sp. PG-2]BAO75988.1 regulatory sensor-transducer, BlaR1/MecR1 family / TonB-dependent receptor [Winogradskyella sp. PG-2]
MDALFSDLGGMYFRLSRVNKAKVKRPIAPIKPYAKITLNGKTYYKEYKDLTKEEKATLPPPPPPPPPPIKKSKGGPEAQNYYNPSFLEYIIEMEQQGASFYLDNEKISAKKAKSIATNNKGKSTEMLTQKDADGKYVVKLSSPEKNKNYARSIDLKILNDGSYIIDGIKATKRTFNNVFNQLHQDITPEIRNNIMNIHVSSSKEISNKETWFIYNALQDYGFYRIVTPNQVINRVKGNTPFAINSHISHQQKLPTHKEVATYNAWAKKIHGKSKKLSSDATWYPPIDEQKFIKFTDIYNRMSQQQKTKAVEYPFLGLEAKASEQQGATKKQIAEYNKLAKHCNSDLESEFPIIKVKDVKRIEYLYGIMSEDQKKNAESYPDFSKVPPPPAPPRPEVIEEQEIKHKKELIKKYRDKNPESVTKANINGEVVEIVEIPVDKEGKTKIAGKEYFFKTKDGETTYYDRQGNKVDINKIPPPPPPTKAAQYKNGKKKTLNEIIKETPKSVKSGCEMLENVDSHYYTVYKGKKTYYNKDGFITNKKGDILPPPPPAPPAPESTLDFVIRMAKANAKFFYKLKPISSDKAIDILKKNPNTHINAQKTDTKEPLVYMSNKPIHVGVKGKDSKKEKGGPNAGNQQVMIDFLIKANNKGAILTQVDAQPAKVPFYNTHLTLDKAISLIKNNSKMRLYPYNRPHSGYIVLISNNIENTIPILTSNNRIDHFNVISSIGAKFYLNSEEINLSKAKRFIKRNPKAEVISSVNPPIVKINTI